MGAKSTRRISRAQALVLLLTEIPALDNGVLETLLDAIADSRQGQQISELDNFMVANFVEDEEA